MPSLPVAARLLKLFTDAALEAQMGRQSATNEALKALDGIPARVRAAGRRDEGTTASVSDARETETGSTRRGEATVDIAVHDRRASGGSVTA